MHWPVWNTRFLVSCGSSCVLAADTWKASGSPDSEPHSTLRAIVWEMRMSAGVDGCPAKRPRMTLHSKGTVLVKEALTFPLWRSSR